MLPRNVATERYLATALCKASQKPSPQLASMYPTIAPRMPATLGRKRKLPGYGVLSLTSITHSSFSTLDDQPHFKTP